MSLGHNGGPALEPGESWRHHARVRARRELLPTLEVVRLRVKRAAALGLDYRSYASLRAATGHDLIVFLFSWSALRQGDVVPEAQHAKLTGSLVRQIAAVHSPLNPEGVRVSAPLDMAGRATGGRLRAMLGPVSGCGRHRARAGLGRGGAGGGLQGGREILRRLTAAPVIEGHLSHVF